MNEHLVSQKMVNILTRLNDYRHVKKGSVLCNKLATYKGDYLFPTSEISSSGAYTTKRQYVHITSYCRPIMASVHVQL